MPDAAEIGEARMVLRYASANLSVIERAALVSWLGGELRNEAARECGVTRQAISEAQKRAFVKIRKRLARMGIRCSAELLSREVCESSFAAPDGAGRRTRRR